jgi:hypothetical protein
MTSCHCILLTSKIQSHHLTPSCASFSSFSLIVSLSSHTLHSPSWFSSNTGRTVQNLSADGTNQPSTSSWIIMVTPMTLQGHRLGLLTHSHTLALLHQSCCLFLTNTMTKAATRGPNDPHKAQVTPNRLSSAIPPPTHCTTHFLVPHPTYSCSEQATTRDGMCISRCECMQRLGIMIDCSITQSCLTHRSSVNLNWLSQATHTRCV